MNSVVVPSESPQLSRSQDDSKCWIFTSASSHPFCVNHFRHIQDQARATGIQPQKNTVKVHTCGDESRSL